jgi:hypothetical protein
MEGRFSRSRSLIRYSWGALPWHAADPPDPSPGPRSWGEALHLLFGLTGLVVAIVFSFERGIPRDRPPRPDQPPDHRAGWWLALWIGLFLLTVPLVVGIVMLITGG